MSKYIFYAASFDDGFNICQLDTEAEKLRHIRYIEHRKPAQFTLSESRKRLYITSEMFGEVGAVSTYDITNPLDPVLLSAVSSGTQGPCYLSLSNDESYLIGGSYFEGNIEVYPVLEDGSLGQRCYEYRSRTTGIAYLPGSFGQAVPRIHCVQPLPDTDYIFATDYSGDRLINFTLDKSGVLHEKAVLSLPEGSAPRLTVLHPVRKDILYLLTEFTSTIYSIKIDIPTGGISIMDCLPSLPENRASFSSAIKVSQDGRFLYVSNRHNKDISVLSLNNNYEKLSYVGELPCAGFVRDVAVDPSGEFLIAGDQEDNIIRLYKRNKQNGMCALLASQIPARTPACFVFLQ